MKFRALLKPVLVSAGVVVGYHALPPTLKVQLPNPRWLLPAKPLTTVSLDEAMAQQASRRGYIDVTFLYLSNLPPDVAVDLADDVKAWRKQGVAIHAFSIDPVPVKGDIAKYVRDIGLDVAPTWIEMPDGAECAFNQMAAVNSFSGRQIDPQQTIPLLTLVLRDRDGSLLNTYAVNVPNGGEIDPEIFHGALLPFRNTVTRAVRQPAD